MLKHLEVSSPTSCLNKAHEEEPVFVLRAKDKAAPDTLKAWVSWRLYWGLNKREDAKILRMRLRHVLPSRAGLGESP